MNTNKIIIISAALFAIVFSSCKKEKDIVYGVNTVNVQQPGANKPNVKSTIEFISIAYSDLFGTTINANQLTELSLAYAGFGDKKFVEDMIIKNFLNKTGVIIPSTTQMNSDIGKFVKDCYRKFYNRDPNEFEQWQMTDYISNTSNITPELIYYAFMTSDEYRYY